ncbi:MAG TPA: hypothetical protein VM492_13485 [Sumerlaeia bacterium]|nr:hypothetical protein [Sumerlaeia bacterium]
MKRLILFRLRCRLANWLARLWLRIAPDPPRIFRIEGRALDRLLDDLRCLPNGGHTNCRCWPDTPPADPNDPEGERRLHDLMLRADALLGWPLIERLPPSILRSEGVPDPDDLDRQWSL